MKLQKIKISLKGVYKIKPTIYDDSRGYFYENYNKRDFDDIGIDDNFVQDNVSFSKRGVLRGIHYQKNYPQSKLVSVISGKIYDIVVDLESGKYIGVELNEQESLYIPKGYGHGFLAIEDSVISYKCDDYYNNTDARGIIWNDEKLKINWNLEKYDIKDIILSEKDKDNPTFFRVMITGADGQVGQDFTKFLKSKNISCFSLSKGELDICDTSTFEKIIYENDINVVINCGAYNNVDNCEIETKKCYNINSYAVRDMVKICEKYGVIFVTYSSDFVFDGKKTTPYTENDTPNPLSIYGKSKYMAEKFALNYRKSLVVRTSFVFSPEYSNNFYGKISNMKNDKIYLADDLISKPTYTKDLVDITWQLVEKKLFGIYNYANDDKTSKYGFGSEILKDKEIIKCNSSLFNPKARRPKYSVLDTNKIKKALNIKISNWKKYI